MPSPCTALQIITTALRKTNAVGVDQTLTAQETADALNSLNDIIEDWSTQTLAVYGQANQTFNMVAGQATYDIGPTAALWVTTRPVRINEPAYTVINGQSFACASIDQESYNLIAQKTLAGAWPNVYLYVNEFPNGQITLWPVPNQAYPITFTIDRVLTQAATAATVLSFPPGYMNAFTYALAVKLGPEFGKKMANYPEVVAEANRSLGNIKRANKRVWRSRYDIAIRPVEYIDWRRGY